MIPVFMLFYSWYRSLNEQEEQLSRTRRRMVGNDVDVDEIVEEDRFSEPQWSGTGHPVLARRLADLSVKVGARARFLVEVSSSTPVSVRWEKDGRTVDESDRISMVTEGNFHCLDISPVCQEDGGLWRVKVTNVVGTAMSSAQLTLLVPKAYKKPEFVEPLRAVLTAQGTVSLECKVIGVPTPLLRWFKGNNEIKAGDVLALTPNASDPTSLGTYTCLAANCMGNAESTSIVHIDGTPATVQGFLPTGPKPIFAKELRNEKIKLGGNVTLECKVTVPPWPEAVNWYGPKGEIVESSRTHLMEDGAGLYSLKISSVNAEDNGTWKCVATNKHGAKAMSTCLISVNYPKNYRKPKFLESLKAVLTEEGLVSFECKVVGYPTPNLSWFKDGQELKPGDVYQLTGTNSLGSYCCIARNCMGEAQSSAELTLEDIKSQLSEEERVQLSSEKLPPRFIAGLKSVEAKINESLKLSVKVSVFPEPTVMWFRDDEVIEDSDRYKIEKDKLGVYHMDISKLEFCDQAEWKCVATNDYGQSVTSSFVKLNIPKHYKKPKFLEDLKAVMSEEGAVNLECKVIGVPQPKLKWFKDGKELKPGDIHKIISGQDGTCCLGTYTCLAQNCMGSVSSSASLLGFEEKGEKSTGVIPETNRNGQVLSRDRSLSTIHEERTSQLHDTDKSTTIDDRAEEVSFSFDGKEVSVSLYETPDLTEEEALQIVEMYADQISEHVTEQNVVELPPMRFTKESSTSGKLVMEAVVIDVSPEYFSSTPAPRKVVEDDLRTDADVDEFSLVEELNAANLSPDRGLSPIENLTLDKINADFADKLPPSKPPRLKTKMSPTGEDKSVKDDKKEKDEKKTSRKSKKKSTDSEKEDDSLQEFEKRKTQSSLKQTTSERKRTESELEDDSLYEFESRKTKDDVFKSCKEDEPLKYSTETGVPKTSDNESQYYSPIKSPTSVVSKMTEDEATFDTAEDSAFDKSEMSVLETLAHSLHEIQKNLTAVEAQVGSESSTGDMQSAQGITEYLAEPLAEVQKNLELVEAQIQEFPSGKYSSDMLETLIQPITKFKKNLALIEEKSLPSILESVAGPLEELNREIAFIQQATQSQIEHAKSVEQVQESLTKIIERQASVPSDRKMMDTIQTELQKLEEKANDDLEVYYDRLLNIGTELRSKANEEQDQEIQDILKAVGDLVKPLKRLTAVTSKTISVIVEDSQSGSVPSKKVVDSLLKPLDALDTSLRLLESVGMLKSHKTIRGAGIPILYKVSVPMEELETTIKLVENLSAHSAVEFLIPPLDNLIKVVSDIDVSAGGEGFLEDLQGEGTPVVKNLDDSLDIMLNCIHSIDKGVTMVDSERNIPGQLPSLLKPMEDLQKSLKAVEKGIKSRDFGYEEVHAIAQELSKPLQAIRSEFSILQHEIEADHYSSEPNPSQTALTTLVGPLESVQNCISSFHETVMCKSADDPIHLRFVLYALKELSEPFSLLSGKMIRTEEVLLGKGDPFQGLKAVARSVSELRESSSAMTADSNVIEQISSILSTPLTRVQNGLETILKCVDKKDKKDLNKDLLKSMDDPFKELQSALIRIEGNIHENVIEGVTPELRQAVQELQRSILIIQDQSSFEYGDEPSTIEANVDILQSLTQPLQTLHAQFTEVQRSTNRTLMKADRALTSLKDSTRRVSVTLEDLKSDSQTKLSTIFQTLSTAIEELETAVEDANSHLSRGKRVDDTRRVLANTLKVASSKLGEVVSKADDLSVSIEPSKRKSLVLVQDFVHNLKVAIEQSTKVIDCDKGTAVDRSRDTLIAIEQLASAMLSFHDQLKSVEEFTSSSTGPQGMTAMKEQVDKLQLNIEKTLSTAVADKNEKMILETIENDVKSVQRVLDNLLSEEATDGARVRFILAKAESIHSDLKDLAKATDSPQPLKTACQAALAVIDIGGSIMNRKSPMKMQIVTQVDPEPEVSVIGELLETMDELDRTFNKLKREAKIRGGDVEVAEMAMEIATLQALIQDVATEASGELLDKAVEVCLPIKTIEVKLAQAANITPSDVEETSIALHNINQVLNSAIRKKEAEKLMQPSTSIIGELLETVGDLETCFDRLKRSVLPNDTTESEVNDVGREILALQNIVDDLTSEATGELLDRAQEICIPIKSIESTLKHHSVLDKKSVSEVKGKLKVINEELVNAIAQNETDKQKREKEFKKLFSSDSLSSSVDIPIVRSIVTTIEYMQAHLGTLIVPPEMVKMKFFLEKFECGLVQYGERLASGKSQNELDECFSGIEETLKTADTTRIEVRKLVKAVESLKLSKGEMPKALAALQSVLSPLKTLHEELSRPNSPKRIKKAELNYLESFSKSSTDLEVGLMKLEKAAVTGTKLEVDCMAVPVEQLALLVEGISHEPTLRNLDEESSVHALRSLAQPINAVQTIVTQIQESVATKDEKKLSELLVAVAKPVRELRTNIALIQDQAMSHCNISQLDELKQAVALMTQVGTETPALKQPLLQLQARLQELEPEAELGEVVGDLTGPVDALKHAVVALETKGENSILLELCHQVVDIIHRSDDTLSEMSSIGPQSTRAEFSPGEGLLLRAAKVCHELLDDSSYSELSHTDDTLTPTHAAEHLPSIQGAATAEQRVTLETVESMKDVSLSVQEAAVGMRSVTGQVKAAVVEHEIGEDQTLSEISEMDNSISATVAAEKLRSIREMVEGEQKIALEEAASLDKSLLNLTEAQAKGVPQEHLQIAMVEHNVMEDHTLSDLSPNEASNSGTLPLEKLASLKGTVAVEEHRPYEEAQSLDQPSLLSKKEAAVEQTSISGKIKAAKMAVEAMEEPSLSALSQSEVSVAVCSPKLTESKEAAVAEDRLAWEQTRDMSEAQLSEQEASIKDVSERQSVQAKIPNIEKGPTELSIVEALLTKGITSVGDLKNIIVAFTEVPQLPQKVGEQFQSFVAKIENVESTVNLDVMLGKLYKDVTEFDDAILKLVKEGKSETSEICCKIVESVKKHEEELLKSVDSKVIETKRLLQGDDQNLGKLQKAVAVLNELPAVRELSEKELQNAVLALKSKLDDLSPSAKPEEILQETLEPKKVLQRIVNKVEKGSPIVTLCCEIVKYIDHGKDIIQEEASALLRDESSDVVKFKKAVALLAAIPADEQKATVLDQPLVALKAKLEEIGSLAKPEDVLILTAEPIKQLKAAISDVEQAAGEQPKILEAAKLVVGSVEKNEQHLQEEVIELLKAERKDLAGLKKAVSVLISVSQISSEKLRIIQAPLQALQAKLEQLSPLAKQEEIIRVTFEPIAALKQTVSNLKRTGENSKALEICDVVVMNTEVGVQEMQKEVTEMLKGEHSVATLKKAVAKLVEIPMEKSQKTVANQPLLALQAKLESMSTKADVVEILRETLEPIKALKQVVIDLPKTGEKSQIAELFELIVLSAEKGKEVMEKEASKLLKGDREVKKLQKAIALLIDVPKDELKFSRVNEPLAALQAQLGSLGPSAKPEEIVRVAIEPAKALKQVISEIKPKSETAGLLEVCQLVVDMGEEGKKAMKKDVEQLLKGEQSLSTLKKAVATLIDIPKDEGEKLQQINLPLKALQAKLEDVTSKAEPSEILRKTVEPIRALKQVVTDLTKAGEKSQLLNICELVIEKAESGKEAMQKEAQKLLAEETQNATKLQKAVALLIDIPKEEVLLSKVNEPLVSLKAELDRLGPSAKPEDILKCTAGPIKALKQAVSNVGKTEKAQLLQLCEMVVQKAEKGKEVVQKEVGLILRGEVQNAATLKKAVAALVELPLEEGQKIEQISKPLTALKATLDIMEPGANRVDIVRGTVGPVKALKKVVQDLKKAGEKSELLEICELVVEKAEQGKAIMQEEAAELLKQNLGDASKLKKAVALLVEVPKEETSEISALVEPLSRLHAKLGTLNASPSAQEILTCTMEPVMKLKQVISDVKKAGEKSQLLDVSSLLLEKFEECQQSAQREAKELLVGETCDVSKLTTAVTIATNISQIKEEKTMIEPLVALEAKLKDLTPQCKPEQLIRCTIEPLKVLKQQMTRLKSKEKSTTFEICESVVRKIEQCKESMQEEAAQLIAGELKDIAKLKKAVALLVDVPKEGEMANMSAPLIALQVKLDKLPPTARPEEIHCGSVDQIQAIQQVITKVESKGEKGALLDICKNVATHIESGKEKEKTLKDVELMISVGIRTILQLTEATKVLKKFSGACESLAKPIEELATRLSFLHSPSNIDDFEADLLGSVKLVKKTAAKLQEEPAAQNEFLKTTVALIEHLEPIFHLNQLLEREKQAKEKKEREEKEKKEKEEKEKQKKLKDQQEKEMKEKQEKEAKEKELKLIEEQQKLEREKEEKEQQERKAKQELEEKELQKKREQEKLEKEKKAKEEQRAKQEKEEKEKELKLKEEQQKLERKKQEKEEEERKAKQELEEKELQKKKEEEKLEKEKKVKEEQQEKEQRAKQEKEEKEKELKLKEEQQKLEREKQEKEEQKRKAKQELEEKELQKKKEQEKLEEEKKERKEQEEKETKAKKDKEEKDIKLKEEQDKLEREKTEKAEKEKQEQELKLKKDKDVQEKKTKAEKEKEATLDKEEKAKKEKENKLKEEQDKMEKEKKEMAEKEKQEQELKLKKEKDEQEKKKREEEEKKATLDKEQKAKKEEENKLKEEHEKLEKEKKEKEKLDKEEKEKKDKEIKLKEEEQKQATEKKRKSIKEKNKKEEESRIEEGKEEKKGEPKVEVKDAQKPVELVEDKEKAEKDKEAREKQQSLSRVEESIAKGVKTIAELKTVVEIMRLYKQVCIGLAEPLDALGLVLENLYEKSQVSDFGMDLVQPVLKLKKATDAIKSEESGLLTITIKLVEHLEPAVGWKEVERKEKQRDEREKMRIQKQQEEEQAKANKIKEEELERERIDTEMRKEKAQAEKERAEEEAKKKKLKEKEQEEKRKEEEEAKKKQMKEKVLAEMEKEKQLEEDAGKKQLKEKTIALEKKVEEEIEVEKRKSQEEKVKAEKEKLKEEDKKTEIEAARKEDALKAENVPKEEVKKGKETIQTSSSREEMQVSRREEKAAEIVEERKIRSQKALEDVERRDAELKLARENERKSREDKLLRMQQERDKEEEETSIRREKERLERENKALEERRKLEKEKEEVEQREKSIKAKLEQVKREKRELEMEEQNKMLQARKLEKERQEKEEVVRKEMEEARVRLQQERELELKKQRLKELERREAELDNIRSRESLRMTHLDDLHKREIAKGISKSLDAVPIYSSYEKVNKGQMEYSSSVTTMSSARDKGVHSARGISVVELMDYEPPPVRPERTKKQVDLTRPLEFNREAHISKWDSRLRELSPDIRRRPKESAYTPPTSHTDVSAYQWDKSKEQSWKHLEYPTPEYDAPSGYHRSRRSISPMHDYGSTQSLTRYQPAPQQVAYQHRSRRSLSPLERSLQQPYSGSTVSLTSLGSRKHLDELISARVRPPTPTRSYIPGRSRSITKNDHRAFIVNGLVDKTVIHGGKIRLSCNIGGDPNPSIEWMKDGKGIAYHTEASRYKTECNYGVACLEVEGARLSDAGQYTCVVKNVDGQSATTCTVRVALNDDDEKEYESIENELEANMPREVCLSIKGSAFGMPRVTGLVADPVVPSGGTIAVHVQVAGCKRPEVTWFREGAPLPKYSPRVHYFEDGGLFTLLLEGATPAESGVYTCRVAGRGRGAVDTMTTVQVVERHSYEKPAVFTAKPDTRMTLTAGEDMTLTCYVGGEPRPQVTLMKGIKDITTSCRTLKESFGEYVRLTLKRVTLEDRGTFFIMAKNIYGTDRTFVTLDVRERARSLTPPSWSERTVSLTSLFKEVHHSTPSWRSASNLHTSYTSLLE